MISDLEDLYREIVLDHYRSPRMKGSLEVPPAIMHEGFNPLCGDEIKIYALKDQDQRIDLRIQSRGCSISVASGSMMAAIVSGQDPEKAKELIALFKTMMSIHEGSINNMSEKEVELDQSDLKRLGDAAALQGVVKFPVRIKCATLAWNTLDLVLNDLSS